MEADGFGGTLAFKEKHSGMADKEKGNRIVFYPPLVSSR
jgi:hypothetical protein